MDELELTGWNAFANSKYLLGIALETYFVAQFLSGYPNPSWLYLLYLPSVAVTAFGLWWYWRCMGPWFVTVAVLAIGMALFYGVRAPDGTVHLAFLASAAPLVFYCLWRLTKLALDGAFRLLLLTVFQLGRAWRGEANH